ncbi:MAG: glycosyltransferase family 4 protein [bacterium]|nr:glycosyltransferase family 4 protein [bacterium]
MMKILMIAPEPFFEPRGTPFSEYYRIRALCKMGHTVDLITYPIGQDKEVEGLTISRCLKPPFVKSVKTGPSVSKIFLDFFLFFKVLGRLFRKRYDVIHTHEEASIMGAFFNKTTKTPHLYDMHSSLVQQMTNFGFTKSRLVIGVFKWMEKISLRNAASSIVICPSLYDYAATITEKEKLTVIENFIDDTSDSSNLDMERLERIKKEVGHGEAKIIMYTGTLEKYQGMPLLIDSITHLPGDFRLVLIGGNPNQMEEIKQIVEEKGLNGRVVLLGRKEPEDMPYYLKASDVLVSPRILGTNIPLKIYSYLKSGVPVVATNLYTHTQSVTDDIAFLVDPEPGAFARGIEEAVSDKGKIVVEKAKAFCKEHYSHERYRQLIQKALDNLNHSKYKKRKS